jgi:hypothetical protein
VEKRDDPDRVRGLPKIPKELLDQFLSRPNDRRGGQRRVVAPKKSLIKQAIARILPDFITMGRA